jgi:membrane protease YdiL (CAAX protease family)
LATQQGISIQRIWLYVLACLGVVVISCGFKNYLAVIVRGTDLCPYLCPSVFPTELFFALPLLESLFEAQRWAQVESQDLVSVVFGDRWNLMSSLVFSPVYEELVFRGPMFLVRGYLPGFLWWFLGIALAAAFALSHGRNGLALLPLLVLGIGGLWLITLTHRFWPTVALHVLHNFFFSSAYVYQSMLVSE